MKKDVLLKIRNNLLDDQEQQKKKIILILERELTEEEIRKYNQIMAIDGGSLENLKGSEIKRCILRIYSKCFTEEEYNTYYKKICYLEDSKVKKI